MTRAIDAAIVALAARQHGNVTTEQLLRLGLGRAAISYRCRTGRLYRVHFGVYSVGRPPATPLERAAAAVLACGPGAVLSHGAALALWGFAERWPAGLDVIVVVDRRPREITVHRCNPLARQDRRGQLGIGVTSPARTLLDCAPRLPSKQLARTVNEALHSPFLKRSQLADVCARCPKHPGVKYLRRFIDTSDGPTRSGWEDDFPAWCERFGLPRPQLNVRVCGYEVDALFEPERLIVELDGWDFHRDRHAFHRDRNRDADTLAAGIATVRITWDRLNRTPGHEAGRLQAILQARRREG